MYILNGAQDFVRQLKMLCIYIKDDAVHTVCMTSFVIAMFLRLNFCLFWISCEICSPNTYIAHTLYNNYKFCCCAAWCLWFWCWCFSMLLWIYCSILYIHIHSANTHTHTPFPIQHFIFQLIRNTRFICKFCWVCIEYVTCSTQTRSRLACTATYSMHI